MYCTSCGKELAERAVICPACGASARSTSSAAKPKDKTVAVLLAVFLAFWTWCYTYSKDAWKFWLNLALFVVSLGFWAPVAWIWAIVDAARRPADFYVTFNQPVLGRTPSPAAYRRPGSSRASQPAAMPRAAECIHDWDGCRCRICNRLRPGDSDHEYDNCVCKKCGIAKGVNEQGHDWDGCKCRICKSARDSGHEYVNCVCKRCWKTMSAGEQGHDWNGCKCTNCAAIRDSDHDWDGCRCRACGATRCRDEDYGHSWEYLYGSDQNDWYNTSTYKCIKCGIGKTENHDRHSVVFHRIEEDN